jgi:hypothetical protein
VQQWHSTTSQSAIKYFRLWFVRRLQILSGIVPLNEFLCKVNMSKGVIRASVRCTIQQLLFNNAFNVNQS